MSPSIRLGLFYSIAANTIWGVFPIYWNLLQRAKAVELMSHRVVWAFGFTFLITAAHYWYSDSERRRQLKRQFSDAKVWKTYSMAAVLIAINWVAFLWAVNNDRVLLSSLGYYINPLVNVLLGVIVLQERLTPSKWLAVALAAVGVTVMSAGTGEVPWVSFAMAISFGLYALVKKRAPMKAMEGLFMETLILFLPATVYLWWLGSTGGGVFGAVDRSTDVLLILGGLLTITPLALFSAATQRAPLSLIGVLQYVGPTLQFLVGAFYFGETLSTYKLIGFGFVWMGVIVFMIPVFRKNSADRK